MLRHSVKFELGAYRKAMFEQIWASVEPAIANPTMPERCATCWMSGRPPSLRALQIDPSKIGKRLDCLSSVSIDDFLFSNQFERHSGIILYRGFSFL